MNIDVSKFHLDNATDTCATWNVLSSRVLFERASRPAIGITMRHTNYVRYECLHKPRRKKSEGDEELKARLTLAYKRGHFPEVKLSVQDLGLVATLKERQSIGLGELSCIAFASKVGIAVLTDDQGARKLAGESLIADRAQTVPHLFGWLTYRGDLSDVDLEPILEEHRSFRRPLDKYLRAAFLEGLRCRLMAR